MIEAGDCVVQFKSFLKSHRLLFGLFFSLIIGCDDQQQFFTQRDVADYTFSQDENENTRVSLDMTRGYNMDQGFDSSILSDLDMMLSFEQDAEFDADLDTGFDADLNINQSNPPQFVSPPLNTLRSLSCPHHQERLGRRCPRTLDAARWRTLWPVLPPSSGYEEACQHHAWHIGGEVSCHAESVVLPSLSLGLWMNARQRPERSDASLTLMLPRTNDVWSISFTLTITEADATLVEQGTSFGFVGLIDENEVPLPGYPGQVTALYLQPNAPPRFYDKGKGSASAVHIPVQINQSPRYTITGLRGEIWIGVDGVLISRAPLRDYSFTNPRHLNAVRFSCVECQAELKIHQWLDGELPLAAILPDSEARPTDGETCEQLLLNPRLERAVSLPEEGGGIPERWSLRPSSELEFNPESWVINMGESGLHPASEIEQDTHPNRRNLRLNLREKVTATHPLSLPEDSCMGLSLQLIGVNGELDVSLEHLGSSRCAGSEAPHRCVLTEQESDYYLITDCPSGEAELRLKTNSNDSSINGNQEARASLYALSLTRLSDNSTQNDEPCDPDPRLDGRRASIEHLEHRKLGQVIPLSETGETIYLWHRQPEYSEADTLPNGTLSTTEFAHLRLDETGLLYVDLILPANIEWWSMSARWSAGDEHETLEWHSTEGVTGDSNIWELNTELEAEREHYCNESQCTFSLRFHWDEVQATVVHPTLGLSLLGLDSAGSIYSFSDAPFSPYGILWGGQLGELTINSVPISILTADEETNASHTRLPSALPWSIAPVVPMLRDEELWGERNWALWSHLGLSGVSIGNPHRNWAAQSLEIPTNLNRAHVDYNLFYGVNFWREGELRDVYTGIASALSTALNVMSNESIDANESTLNRPTLSMSIMDEPLIHPLSRCTRDLQTLTTWSELRDSLLAEAQSRCVTPPCLVGEARLACRATFASLIIELASDVSEALEPHRELVSLGINVTGDLGLTLVEELARMNHLSGSPLDHISVTNNWISQYPPLSWSNASESLLKSAQQLNPHLDRVHYGLGSGPVGVWRPLRAPSAQEARAMSLNALANGFTFQRIFSWPLSSLELAIGLGSLDQSIAAQPELLLGTQRELITSHPLIRANLIEGETKHYLIIVNRDTLPHYANIRLSSSEVRPLGFISDSSLDDTRESSTQALQVLISASDHLMSEDLNPPSALISRLTEQGPYLITVALNGWDAQIYELSEALRF